MSGLQQTEIAALLRGCADWRTGPAGGVMPARLPSSVYRQVPDLMFQWATSCPCGVTLAVRIREPLQVSLHSYTTDAPVRVAVLHGANGEAGIDQVELLPSGQLELDRGTTRLTPLSPATMTIEPRSPSGEVRLLLPHTAPTEIVAVASDAPIEPLPDDRPVWLHYGSSISHGAEAAGPHDTWPQQVARAANLRLRDFSMGGSAQLDPAVARVMATIPARVITLAVGINITNADSMRERAFVPALHGFLDLLRDRQPRVPIVLVSPICCPAQEDTPGPIVSDPGGRFRSARREVESDDGTLTLRRIRTLMAAAVADRGDDVTYVDGLEVFGHEDAPLLHDGLHPGQQGIDLIAKRVAPWLGRFLARPEAEAATG